MKILLDSQSFSTKPSKSDVMQISRRIPGCVEDMSSQEIAEQLVQPYGRTISPVIFKEIYGRIQRKNVNFASQQLFMLDFDDTDSIENTLAVLAKYDLKPCFAYSTFSSIDNNKFRIAFVLENEIADSRVRDLVQQILLTILPESDQSCKDAARMFFGGQELIHEDYAAIISVENIFSALDLHYQEKHGTYYQKKLKDLFDEFNLYYSEDLVPLISVQCDGNRGEFEENVGAYKIYKESFSFNQSQVALISRRGDEAILLVFHSDKPQQPREKAEGSKENVIFNNYNWKNLSRACQIFRDFTEGVELEHGIRFALLTNLYLAKGGAKLFKSVIAEHYTDSVERWDKHIKYVKRAGYKPQRCDNFCPYKDDCVHPASLIFHHDPRNHVVSITRPEPISVKEAYANMETAFKEAMDAEGNGVYVIKAPTGLGKTKVYLKETNIVIALPTHKLMTEIRTTRFPDESQQNILSIDEPDPSILAEVKHLYDIGAYSKATYKIRKMANNGNEKAADYISTIDNARTHDGILLITHARALITEPYGDTVIIDEDPFQELYNTGKVTYAELNKACKKAPEQLTGILKLVDKTGYDNTAAMQALDEAVVDDIFYLIRNAGIKNNILQFLRCGYFYRDMKNYIHFITVRPLPVCKTIILSATAEEWVYNIIAKDRDLVFTDIGDVEMKGQIIQDVRHSFTKTSIKTYDKKFMKQLYFFAEGTNVITYEEYEKEFKNSKTRHFGDIRGFDGFKDADLVVFGTYHISAPAYFLCYAALYDEAIPIEQAFGFVAVEYDGMGFYFNTFTENERLRNIQLFLIGSELIQAVGRVRVLHFKNTVYVFSRYPAPGAIFEPILQPQNRHFKYHVLKKLGIHYEYVESNRPISTALVDKYLTRSKPSLLQKYIGGGPLGQKYLTPRSLELPEELPIKKTKWSNLWNAVSGWFKTKFKRNTK